MKSMHVRVACWAIFWLSSILFTTEYLLGQQFPWRIVNLEPYLLLGENDDWTHNAFEIQRFLKTEKPAANTFIYLGGSSALESITEDAEMTAQLQHYGLSPTQFISLCSSYKTFADDAKIAAMLTKSADLSHVTLLIPTEIWRFKVPPRLQLALTDEEGRRIPKYYFLPVPKEINQDVQASLANMSFAENHSYLVRTFPRLSDWFNWRIIKPLYRGQFQLEIQHDRHNASQHAKPPSQEWLDDFNAKTAASDSYQKNARYNFLLLSRIIEIWKSKGGNVVLVEMPVNPATKDALELLGKGYKQERDKILSRYNIDFIDMSAAEDWENKHFRDQHHMLQSGREKFTKEFAAALVVHAKS